MSNLSRNSGVMIDEDEYPIILYEPNSDLSLKMSKAVHLFSVSEEAVNFIHSQEVSFLLVVPNDFNEAIILQDLRKKDLSGRRLVDVEEESILKEILKEKAEKSLYKIYVFFTSEDFESEIFVEKETMKWDVKEAAKGFREEFIFCERKQRGLENADIVFEYIEEPKGFADFWEENDYVKCKEFCVRKLKELVSKRKQEKKKLIYYVNLGKCCYKLKEHQKALEYYTKAFDIVKQTYGETHASIAYLFSYLAKIHQDLCEHQNALDYQMRAVDIRKSIYWEEHPQTAFSSRYLAYILRDLGEFQKALDYCIKALEIMKSRYGEMHFATANLYEKLALAYNNIGKFDKALEENQKALDIRKSIFGETHPLVAESYDNIAISYLGLEDDEKELEFYLKALEVRKSGYGEIHSQTACSYHDIAIFYREMEKYQQALEHEQKALEIRKNVFGEKHIETAKSYNNLGMIINEQGNHEQAIEYHLKALEIRRNCYGREKHIDVSESYNNFGLVYNNLTLSHGKILFPLKKFADIH